MISSEESRHNEITSNSYLLTLHNRRRECDCCKLITVIDQTRIYPTFVDPLSTNHLRDLESPSHTTKHLSRLSSACSDELALADAFVQCTTKIITIQVWMKAEYQ